MISTAAVVLATAPSSPVNNSASDTVTVAAIIGLAIILILNMIKESISTS